MAAASSAASKKSLDRAVLPYRIALGVERRGPDACMTQQFADVAEIGAGVEA